MKKSKIFLLFLIVFACDSASETKAVKHYFDTKSELEKIIEVNNQIKPNVHKVWMYNAKKSDAMVSDINWNKELKLFLDADLNKSSYVTSYDSVKSLNSLSYSLKKGENLPIRKVSITMDSLGKMVAMKSIRKSENYFFSMGSEIELSIKDGKLKSYEIVSTEKLLWFDIDSSKVTGKID